MIEPLDRSLFELVTDSDGRILDIDAELTDILPSPSGSLLSDIFDNFEEFLPTENVQNVTLKSKFSYTIPAQLILRGRIEDDTVFRTWLAVCRFLF